MIKIVMFVKRKEGISREEFIRHYEKVHAPLSLKLLPKYEKYGGEKSRANLPPVEQVAIE